MEKDTAIRSADIDLGFIDLNLASEKELADLPGVGRELARKIVRNRPFESMEDLSDVPGISPDDVDQLTRAGAMVGEPVHEERKKGSFEI